MSREATGPAPVLLRFRFQIVQGREGLHDEASGTGTALRGRLRHGALASGTQAYEQALVIAEQHLFPRRIVTAEFEHLRYGAHAVRRTRGPNRRQRTGSASDEGSK
jgi:hypothetical protein